MLYVSIHKIRNASDISKYRLLQRWNSLTFLTVNPENFSLIPLYHLENEANFWFPNTVKHAMFTPDFCKERKM